MDDLRVVSGRLSSVVGLSTGRLMLTLRFRISRGRRTIQPDLDGLLQLGPVLNVFAGRLLAIDLTTALGAQRADLAVEVLRGGRDPRIAKDRHFRLHFANNIRKM